MKTLVPPAFDSAVMERRCAAFRATVTSQLELLSKRTLFDLRPRDRLFSVASSSVALGRIDEARAELSTIARLTALSLEAGDTPGVVSIELRWPPEVPTLTTRGPADPVGASDWLFGYAAALVAADAEAAQRLLALRGRLLHAKGVSIDPYWAPLGDAWAAIAQNEVRQAGAQLARALELADPEFTVMSGDYVLTVPVPMIEVMFHALENDQTAFTAGLEKGFSRFAELYPRFEDLAMLPVYLLAAARLGLQRGLRLELAGPQVAVLTS